MAQVTRMVRRIPSLIIGLSIGSGVTPETCGQREGVALGRDRNRSPNARQMVPVFNIHFTDVLVLKIPAVLTSVSSATG